MESTVFVTKIFFQHGWLIVDIGNTVDMDNEIVLLVHQKNQDINKIRPSKMIDSCFFYAVNQLPFGEKQIVELTNENHIQIEHGKDFIILSGNATFIEKENSSIYLTKISRADLSLLASEHDTQERYRIPAFKMDDQIILFDNVERLKVQQQNDFGQVGILVHNIDGSNYFETNKVVHTFGKLMTQRSFQSEVISARDNRLSILINDPIKIDQAGIIFNDTIILAQVQENVLTFDFGAVHRNQYIEQSVCRIKLISGNTLMTGQLRFRDSDFHAINDFVVVSNNRLQILGNLFFNRLPGTSTFDQALPIKLDVIQSDFGSLKLGINRKIGQALLVLKRHGRNIYTRFAGSIADGNPLTLHFNLSLFMHHHASILSGRRWDAFLIIFDEASVQVNRIISSKPIYQQNYLNYGPLLEKSPNRISTYDQKFEYYFNHNNELSLVKNSDSKLLIERFDIKSDVVGIKRKDRLTYQLTIKISGASLNKITCHQVIAVNRNKHTYVKINLPTQLNSKSDHFWKMTADLKMSVAQLIPFYWDLYVEVTDEFGNHSLLQIQNASKSVRQSLRKNVFKWQIKNQGQLLAPYITVHNNLAFVYHPIQDFETSFNYLKENIARVIEKLFRKQLKKKHIWISYEKNAMGAHDNAFTFFEYMYKNSKHNQFYYVIRPDSPELKNLSNMNDRVLKFMSLKYFVYMFAAELFISSDTKYHSYNLHQRDSHLGRRMSRVKEVYLQHGVNGLKQVPAFHKKRGLLDFIIVPDEYEKNMVVKQWGYDAKQVAVTGLARWDKYTDLTKTISFHQIFVMPTWRKWMDGMSPEEFVSTPFYQQYQAFLSSPRLKEILSKNNTRIAFFLHPYFKDYVHLFHVDNSVIDQYGYLDVNMGEAIQKSSMMISDYSSVLWDMYYLKKPVVFYQFDRDDYLANEKSYMDYDTELFGDVTFDSESTIDAIAHYIGNQFTEKTEYAERRKNYFTYMDHHNSERIYEAIRDNKRHLGI